MRLSPLNATDAIAQPPHVADGAGASVAPYVMTLALRQTALDGTIIARSAVNLSCQPKPLARCHRCLGADQPIALQMIQTADRLCSVAESRYYHSKSVRAAAIPNRRAGDDALPPGAERHLFLHAVVSHLHLTLLTIHTQISLHQVPHRVRLCR